MAEATRVFHTPLKVKSVEEKYFEQLRAKGKQILYYKDFKAKQSTEMIGESLKQPCMSKFIIIAARRPRQSA